MSTNQLYAHDLSYGTIPKSFKDVDHTSKSSSRPIIIHTTYAQPLLAHNINTTKRYPLTTKPKRQIGRCYSDCCFNLQLYCYFILLLLLLPLCVSLGLIIGGHEVASTAYNTKMKAGTFNINGTCQCIATSNYTDDSGELHYKATYIPLHLYPCASAGRMDSEYTFDLHWTQNMSHIEHCYTDSHCSEVFLCADPMCNEYGIRSGQLMLVAIGMYVVAAIIVIGIFICGVLKGRDMRIYLHERYLGQINIGGVVSYYDGYECNDIDSKEISKRG